MLGEFTDWACPVCGSTDVRCVSASERIDLRCLDRHAFSSRKRPKHMRLRLFCCPRCDPCVRQLGAHARGSEAAGHRAGGRRVQDHPQPLPLRHWTRLLPPSVKAADLVKPALERTRAANRSLTLPVGNLLAWRRPPADGEPLARASAG